MNLRQQTSISLSILAILSVVALLCMAVIFPVFYIGIISLTDHKGYASELNFVGLKNYLQVIDDPAFLLAMKNTLLFASASTLGMIVCGTALALIVYRWPKNQQYFVQMLFFVPYFTVPVVVVTETWRFLADINVGVITQLTGIALFTPDYIMFTVILVTVWVFSPFVMSLVLARLRQIPSALLESLTLDGAGAFAKFRYIIFPHLLPVFISVAVLRFILTATKFDLPYLLLGTGAAAFQHAPVAIYLFEKAYEESNYGVSSAAAMVSLLALLIPVFIAIKYQFCIPK